MSASRIYLDRFPSFCQKLSKLVQFDEVLTKTNLLSFLGHGVDADDSYEGNDLEKGNS